MLVLSRRPGESIQIRGDVEITVLELRGNRVRLGIRAARQISVYREEVYERASAGALAEGSSSDHGAGDAGK